jgi:hypothetical protein
MSDIDPVNHPSHYRTFPEQEAIQIIEAVLTPEEYRGYLKGNFLKYRLRAGDKGPAQIDIEKSNWYKEELWMGYYDQCERDLEKFYGQKCNDAKPDVPIDQMQFCTPSEISHALKTPDLEYAMKDYIDNEKYSVTFEEDEAFASLKSESWGAPDFGLVQNCTHDQWYYYQSTHSKSCQECGKIEPWHGGA